MTNAQYATLVATAKTAWDSAVTAFAGSATAVNAGLLSIAGMNYAHALSQYARNLDIPNLNVNSNLASATNAVARWSQTLSDAQAAVAAATPGEQNSALRNAVDVALTNLKVAERALTVVNSISATPVIGV